MKHRVVIAGAGFSGSATALQLLRQESRPPLEILLVDPRGTFGPGLAYSAHSERFRLNVRAKGMGAWPDAPGDFLEWLRREGISTDGEAFVPRSWYGRYLQDLVKNHPKRYEEDRLVTVTDRVTDVEPLESLPRFFVRFEKSMPIECDAAIVAVGNLERASIDGIRASEYFASPYEPSTYTELAAAKSVLVVGSGLTAVDFILEAEASGFKGRYVVLSRHGRLPLRHEESPPSLAASPSWRTLEGLRQIVRHARDAGRTASSSQAAIDDIRPHLQHVWQRLSEHDRKRFLRHVRPVWEALRHRIPGPHGEVLSALADAGRLVQVKGRVRSIERDGGSLQVRIALRGKDHGEQVERFDRAVLCVGPESDVRRQESTLVRNLLDRGLIVPGPLGLGAAPSGARRLWVIGPLQKEALWEITAVRELREEAAKVAGEVCEALGE